MKFHHVTSIPIQLDDDFHTMERKTEVMNELVEDLQIKTKEYLQPNPTVRAKMAAVKVSFPYSVCLSNCALSLCLFHCAPENGSCKG